MYRFCYLISLALLLVGQAVFAQQLPIISAFVSGELVIFTTPSTKKSGVPDAMPEQFYIGSLEERRFVEIPYHIQSDRLLVSDRRRSIAVFDIFGIDEQGRLREATLTSVHFSKAGQSLYSFYRVMPQRTLANDDRIVVKHEDGMRVFTAMESRALEALRQSLVPDSYQLISFAQRRYISDAFYVPDGDFYLLLDRYHGDVANVDLHAYFVTSTFEAGKKPDINQIARKPYNSSIDVMGALAFELNDTQFIIKSDRDHLDWEEDLSSYVLEVNSPEYGMEQYEMSRVDAFDLAKLEKILGRDPARFNLVSRRAGNLDLCTTLFAKSYKLPSNIDN